MTVEKRNKILYFVFKFGGILVSCFLPIWAIYEKFPIWTESHGASRTVGMGMILTMFVFLIIFRKTILQYLKDKFKINHAPPITIWIVLLIVSYMLLYIAKFLLDLTTVLWMGMIGCAIGNVFTYTGEHFFGKKEN